MVSREQAASHDVVVAADVFIYVGRIDALCAEVKRILRPRGLFAFSVEALELIAANACCRRRDARICACSRAAALRIRRPT